MVTIFDMVNGKILSRSGERIADTTQRVEWPADPTLPSLELRLVEVSASADRPTVSPVLAALPIDALLDE
jgi:hypothetical protein